MAKVKVYNLEGAEVGFIDIDDKLMAEEAKSELLYQVVRVLQTRSRAPLAHTKDRGEVRGGGRKPWRQKGTGRARAGTNRSPLWRGGGITFGPSNKNVFSNLTIPRKMAQKVLRAVFSQKVKEEKLIVFDNLSLDKPSTKNMATVFKNMGLDRKKSLLLTEATGRNTAISVRNLPKVSNLRLENINILDLLDSELLIAAQSTIEKLVKQLKKPVAHVENI